MSDTGSVNFRDLLKQPTETLDRPKSLPDGHYIATILSHEFDRTRGKGTGFVRFILKIEEPTADVADDVSGYDFNRIELRMDYFITPKALFLLGDMLDNILGPQPGRNLDERIPEAEGARIVIKLSRRLNEDGSDSGFNNIDTRTVIAAT